MSGLYIKASGTFTVLIDGIPAEWSSKVTGILLALLTLEHGVSVERAKLRKLCFPVSKDPAGSFNRQLGRLRSDLGTHEKCVVTQGKHHILLNLSPSQCDLVAFDDAIRRLDNATVPGALKRLATEALELQGNMLVHDLENQVKSDDGRTVVVTARKKRAEGCAKAQFVLASAALAEMDLPETLEQWSQLELAILIPLDQSRVEDFVRRLMVELARGGDMQGLGEQFHKLETAARKLNRQLDHQTTRLHRSLIESNYDLSPGAGHISINHISPTSLQSAPGSGRSGARTSSNWNWPDPNDTERSPAVRQNHSTNDVVRQFWPDLPLTRPSTGQRTPFFEAEARGIAAAADRPSTLTLVVANPGTGKSRTVSHMFKPGSVNNVVPVWYKGNNPDDVARKAGDVRRIDPTINLCIVLDEDNQAEQNTAFFEKVASFLPDLLRKGHSILLSIRSSTNEFLSRSGCLPCPDDVFHLGLTRDTLSRALIGGDQPRNLTDVEIDAIVGLASNVSEDAGGPATNSERSLTLNTLIVDRICLPRLEAGEPLPTFENAAAPSHLRTIEDYLISTQPAPRQRILEALYRSGSVGCFLPTWLVYAALRSHGISMSIDDAKAELSHLLIDEMIQKRELMSGAVAWSFGHDLIRSSVGERLKRQQTTGIAEAQLTAESAQIVESQGHKCLSDFAEGAALWASLAASASDGGLPVVHALARAADLLAQTGNVAGSIVKVVCSAAGLIRVGDSAVTPALTDGRMYAALYGLTEIVARHVTPELLVAICEKQAQIVTVVELIGISLSESNPDYNSDNVELLQHEIEPIKKIGGAFKDISIDQAFQRLPSFFPRIRFTQLLVWAGLFVEAGDAAVAAVRHAVSHPSPKDDVCNSISRIDYAVALFMHAGNLTKAVEAYEVGVDLARAVVGMDALAGLYEANAQRLRGIEGTQLSWQSFMADRRQHLLGDRKWEEDIAVVCHFPDMSIGSVIAHQAKNSDLSCRLIYTGTIHDLNELEGARAIIVVGGSKRHKLTNTYISDDDKPRIGIAIDTPDDFCSMRFVVNGCPAIWLVGAYPWDTVVCVRRWLDRSTGGIEQFLREI